MQGYRGVELLHQEPRNLACKDGCRASCKPDRGPPVPAAVRPRGVLREEGHPCYCIFPSWYVVSQAVFLQVRVLTSRDKNEGQPTEGQPTPLFSDDALAQIAKKHGVTVGQVLISWCVQRGISTVPKSEKEERIKQNITVRDTSTEFR